MTAYPCTSSHSFSPMACVLRPQPSVPSMTINFPVHPSRGRYGIACPMYRNGILVESTDMFFPQMTNDK